MRHVRRLVRPDQPDLSLARFVAAFPLHVSMEDCSLRDTDFQLTQLCSACQTLLEWPMLLAQVHGRASLDLKHRG